MLKKIILCLLIPIIINASEEEKRLPQQRQKILQLKTPSGTIFLPVIQNDEKKSVQRALYDVTLQARAKDFANSLKYYCTSSSYDTDQETIRATFALNNVWVSALSLIHFLKTDKSITKSRFIESYITPLKKEDYKKIEQLANHIVENKTSYEAIGATLYLFYCLIKPALDKQGEISNLAQFAEELFTQTEAIRQAKDDIHYLSNLHATIMQSQNMASLSKEREQNLNTMLRKKKDVLNKADHGGFYPLHYAAFINSKAIVQYLLALGCSASVMSEDGLMPFMLTSDPALAKLLLERTDINCRDKIGRTPLMLALQKNSKQVQLLLPHKPQINISDNVGNWTHDFLTEKSEYWGSILMHVDVNAICPHKKISSKCHAVELGSIVRLMDLIKFEEKNKKVVDNKAALALAKTRKKNACKKGNEDRQTLYTEIIKLLESTHTATPLEVEKKEKQERTDSFTQKKESISVSSLTAEPSPAIFEQAPALTGLAASLTKTQKKKLKKQQKISGASHENQLEVITEALSTKIINQCVQELATEAQKEQEALRAALTKKYEILNSLENTMKQKLQPRIKVSCTFRTWAGLMKQNRQRDQENNQKLAAFVQQKNNMIAKNVLTAWHSLAKGAKESEIKRKKEAELQCKLLQSQQDQAARILFEAQVAYGQDVQAKHGVPVTLRADLWWNDHKKAIQNSIDNIDLALNPNWNSLLRELCPTCVQHDLLVLSFNNPPQQEHLQKVS